MKNEGVSQIVSGFNCEFHGFWSWKDFCPTCRVFEKTPEKFCEKCRTIKKNMRVAIPWTPRREIPVSFCPKCEVEKNVVATVREGIMREDFPDDFELDGEHFPAHFLSGEEPPAPNGINEHDGANGTKGYVSKLLPVLKPELIMDVMRCMSQCQWFRSLEIREKISKVLVNHPEYDPDNDKTQDLVIRMIAKIDDALMARRSSHCVYWDHTNNMTRSSFVTEYRLTDYARQIAQSNSTRPLVKELIRACERTYPRLRQFTSHANNKDRALSELAREYATMNGWGVSQVSDRNRDIEAWIQFLRHYTPSISGTLPD